MIPFVDLKIQYHNIKSEIDAAVLGVLESCQFALGKEVGAFEEEFAQYCGSENGVGVNSGTSALHLALLAADIGPGDEVITVPFTFVATTAAVVYTGAKPVFVDIDPRSYTMDPARIEEAITPQTKAILPVHLYGQTADMDPILEIARKYGILVIEDAAQAHGAEYKGCRAGSMGDMGCFSFYPGKNLGAYGEGGMVVTNNSEYVRKIRMLRDWGSEKKYFHDLKGYNYRMEGIQGAVLRVKLRHLESWTESRRLWAALYNQIMEPAGILTPQAMPDRRHVFHVYAIRTPNRSALQAHLHSRQIFTNIHYPIPVHLQEAYSDLGYKKGDFPHSEQAADEVLSLPMFPELTEAQVRETAEAVLAFHQA
ncbi:MAG: DegT/DnrJ/EryC1/StrS family aminotransferase [Candidatus Omnitrophota bacterium]